MADKLDGKFCYQNAPWLSWSDILFGFVKGYVDADAVIEFASQSLSDFSSKEHFELALADPQLWERLEKLLQILANQDGRDLDGVEGTWNFLFLKQLFAKRESLEKPMQAVALLYADLGYPKFMESIVQYMPSNDGVVLNDDVFLERWASILLNYAQKHNPNGSDVNHVER